MKLSIFNLLIAGGNAALVTLLFNGRYTGIYYASWDSELVGSLHEAAAGQARRAGAGTLGDPPLTARRARGPQGAHPTATAGPSQGSGSHF